MISDPGKFKLNDKEHENSNLRTKSSGSDCFKPTFKDNQNKGIATLYYCYTICMLLFNAFLCKIELKPDKENQATMNYFLLQNLIRFHYSRSNSEQIKELDDDMNENYFNGSVSKSTYRKESANSVAHTTSAYPDLSKFLTSNTSIHYWAANSNFKPVIQKQTCVFNELFSDISACNTICKKSNTVYFSSTKFTTLRTQLRVNQRNKQKKLHVTNVFDNFP